MMKRAGIALAALAAMGCVATLPVLAQEEAPEFVAKIPERQAWSFSGPFGIYDTAQLQRGYKIYREVCATCHSMTDMKFRNLSEPGGPQFTEGQVEQTSR